MPVTFRAVHAQWGTVFAHLPDLGCAQAWEAVWKVRPPAPLTCHECGHPMHAKVSRNGLRFFAHAPGAPDCALALETLAHHMLKLELANAARDAGAHAEMEVRGPDGTWRADVLASDPGGAWRMALEAQLAPVTAAEITARTQRMRAAGVTSLWFSDRLRPPWLGTVPSVRLTRRDDGSGLVAAEGLVKFVGHWEAVPVSLVQFLDWAFTGRIVPYRPPVGPDYRAGLVWTAPRYIRAFNDYLAELGRQAVQERRRRDAMRSARPKPDAAARQRLYSEVFRRAALNRAARGSGL
jgi:competence protein CoiA